MGRYTGNCLFDLSPPVSGLLAQGMEVLYSGWQEAKGREDVGNLLWQSSSEDRLDSSLGAIHQLCKMTLRSWTPFLFCKSSLKVNQILLQWIIKRSSFNITVIWLKYRQGKVVSQILLTSLSVLLEDKNVSSSAKVSAGGNLTQSKMSFGEGK